MATEYEEFTPGGKASSTAFEEFTPAQAKQPTATGLTGRALAARRLGLLARIPARVATGTIGALGDFGAGVTGLVRGKYTPSPIGSEAIEKQLDRFVPRPQGFEENAVDLIGQMALGKLDKAGLAIARGVGAAVPHAPAAFKPAANQTRQLAEELHREGFKILPSEGRGGGLGRTLAGAGGEKRIGQQFQFENQDVANQLARKATGLNPQIGLTQESLIDRATTLANQGYEPVRKIPAIGIGSKYRQELQKIVNDLATNPSFPAADKQEVLTAVNKNLFDSVGSDGQPTQGARYLLKWTGSDAVKQVQALRERASSLYKVQGGDKDVPRALTRLADAIEDQIEYHLKRTNQPGVIDQFRATRTELAKNYAVRKILSDQYTGTVDPRKARALQEGGERLTGELETLAKAGSPRFSQSTRAPTEEPSLYTPWETGMIGAGFGSTLAPGTQVFGPLFAAAVAARPGIRKMVGSKPMQSFMFNSGPPLVSPETEMLMKLQAARQFAPLFSQGDQ